MTDGVSVVVFLMVTNGKHWNLETELGIGYAYLKYDKYLRNRCGRFIDTGHRNYWGPTKLSISFMYLFKSRQK